MILEEGKVSFSQAVRDFWKGYFDFKGRSTRAGYWWAVLFEWLVLLGLGLLGCLFMLISGMQVYMLIMAGLLFFIAMIIFGFATIIPTFMVQFRRWRDAGLTNAAIIILFILPICFAVITGYYSKVGGVLTSIVSLITFVITLLPTDQLTVNTDNAFLNFLFRTKR